MLSLIKLANLEVGRLFQVGDKIVYPMHGAGIIQAIEEKEILGKKQQYYIIKMSISNMQVMIPTTKMLNSNIRPVMDIIALKDIMYIFQHGETDQSQIWKQRFKVNSEKIKTGKLQEGAEVVRDLMRIKEEKALNESEKKMLVDAQRFLLSELELINGITENQIKCFT